MSANRLVVGMADCRVSGDSGDVLITYALGSCIGLAMYDPVSRAGGLLHFMLPDSSLDAARAGENPYRFADLGIPALLREVCERGARFTGSSRAVRHRLRITVAGAAELMDEGALFNIGKRNRAALHRILWKEGVLIGAEAVGGTTPRTLGLEIGSGRFFLRAAGEPEREMLASRISRIGRSERCH
ncbi:MAG: chemotaxis protein CheD [Bryobacteraceae bacterium]